MKKFLRMLNDFLHVREYEHRIRQELSKCQSELTYVQLLLIESKNPDVTPDMKAQVDNYIFFIKNENEKRKRNIELVWKQQ